MPHELQLLLSDSTFVHVLPHAVNPLPESQDGTHVPALQV
jgi:hypothetical protein